MEEYKAVQVDYSNKLERAAQLEEIWGHPLNTLHRENEVLAELLKQAKERMQAGETIDELFEKIRSIAIHYAKKGDLLYPQLKVKYEIAGPSDLMWTSDDEIRDEMAALAKEKNQDAAWKERMEAVLKAAEDMIYKDEKVLFPICAVNFTKEEWKGIYRDSKDYAICMGVEPYVWEEGEEEAEKKAAAADEISMPGGHMTVEQMTAMLNTLPMELTFVDENNINRYFNEGAKVFKRPGMAIDREVFSCHPPKIESLVRAIIEDFRNGVRDKVPVWMEKGGRSFLVTYMAVRDKEKHYLGTVEVVQDMEEIKKHFEGQKDPSKA